MTNYSKYFIQLLPIMIVFIACAGQTLKQPNQIKNETIILDDWQYLSDFPQHDSTAKPFKIIDVLHSDQWEELNSLKDIPHNNNSNFIHLKTKLPKRKSASSALYITEASGEFYVYLNEEMIYKIVARKANNDAYFGEWEQSLIDLPPYNEGDILTLRIKEIYNSENIIGRILLGSYGAIIRKIISYSFKDVLFSILFLVIGIILILANFTFSRSKLLFGIAFFIISLAVFIASNSLFLKLLFAAPAIYYHLDYISFFSFTIFSFYNVEHIIANKFKNVFKSIWLIQLACFILSLALINLIGIPWNEILPYFFALLLASIITYIFVMILSLNKSTYESKILFIGMVGFSIFGILEIVEFIITESSRELGYSVQYLYFGALWFVFSMLWIELTRYKNAYAQTEAARQKEHEAIRRENKVREFFTMKLLESQEKERNRIALELHDSVGQKLVLIKNQLLSIIRSGTKEWFSANLEKINKLTGETLQELRVISHNLRPQHLDQLGLKTAIETLVEKVEKTISIKINIRIDEIDGLIPQADEINFYRIVQETLNNIIKHSEATEVSIIIRKTDTMINMEIEDNGIGIKPLNNQISGGMGLLGMQERAKIIGGKLSFGSANNSGTFVKMEIPLTNGF